MNKIQLKSIMDEMFELLEQNKKDELLKIRNDVNETYERRMISDIVLQISEK